MTPGNDAGGRTRTALVTGGTLPWLSRRSGFWAIAFSFLAVAAFSTAPSSLYGLYERQEHLSSLTITIVYAVYALGIVVSLLLAGHVSDWYGRRTVLLPALAVAVVAAVIFLTWRSLAGIIVARVLTGLALGAAVATATAFVTDLDAGPDGVATRRAGIVATIANIGGLALGPLIAGLLARYAGHGLTLPFIVFLALLLAAVGLVIVAPEGHPAIHPRPKSARNGSRRRRTGAASSWRPRPGCARHSLSAGCSPGSRGRSWPGHCTSLLPR